MPHRIKEQKLMSRQTSEYDRGIKDERYRYTRRNKTLSVEISNKIDSRTTAPEPVRHTQVTRKS